MAVGAPSAPLRERQAIGKGDVHPGAVSEPVTYELMKEREGCGRLWKASKTSLG